MLTAAGQQTGNGMHQGFAAQRPLCLRGATGWSKAVYLVLAPVGELLEDVTGLQAEGVRGEEVGAGSDEAAVCQGRQRSPLSIGQASACRHTTALQVYNSPAVSLQGQCWLPRSRNDTYVVYLVAL